MLNMVHHALHIWCDSDVTRSSSRSRHALRVMVCDFPLLVVPRPPSLGRKSRDGASVRSDAPFDPPDKIRCLLR